MLKEFFLIFAFLCVSLFVVASDPQSATKGRKLRFFTLDVHSSVTSEVKAMLEANGHELDFWTFSPLCEHIFGRPKDRVEIINEHNCWGITPEICAQFYERYKEHLSQYDGFVVSLWFGFSYIFEKLNKPVLFVNAVRYEIPFSNQPERWEHFDNFLIDGYNSNKFLIVSNNKADHQYLKYYTDIDSILIPSLCLYTNLEYTGTKDSFACQPQRNRATNDYAINSYPYIIKSIATPYSWADLFSYKGIIHFPYQVSTMSIFEEYSANIPLFFPTKDYLTHLVKCTLNNQLNEVSFYAPGSPNVPGDPNNMSDANVIKFWIDNADFYDEENMPYIQYFGSLEHLHHLLHTVNTKEISMKMKVHNIKRKEMVYQKWKEVIGKLETLCENP